MASFIRIGKHIINLDAINTIEYDDDGGFVIILFRSGEGTESTITLSRLVLRSDSNEAIALRKYFDRMQVTPDLCLILGPLDLGPTS